MELKWIGVSPNGCRIHTFNRTIWNWNFWPPTPLFYRKYLLIELYGIEILLAHIFPIKHQAFNRTIWNWNRKYQSRIKYGLRSFNRTIWNWNYIWKARQSNSACLLIELYGIEIVEECNVEIEKLTFNRTIWNWNNFALAGWLSFRVF